jgi:hypothetical protein
VTVRRALVVACVVLVYCAVPQAASAGPLFELAFGDGANYVPRAAASGARAAYFNPALLVEAPSGASLGFVLLVERLEIDVAARDSVAACEDAACDVPEIDGAGPESFRHEDGSSLEQPTLPTVWLESGRGGTSGLGARPRQAADTGDSEHGYLALGLVQATLDERFAFGLSALLPVDGFMASRAFYADEREQFFGNSLHHELYGDRLQAADLAFGAGVRVIDELAIGASLTLGIASTAHAPVYVSNLGDLDTVLLDSNVSVGLSLAPHFGVAFTPARWLRLSATAHSPQGTKIETSFSYVIATGIEQQASQSFHIGYLPWTFGLGAEATFGEPARGEWSIAASGTYALWSDYRDRHDERPSGRYEWSDVLGAALGVRGRLQQLSGYVSGAYAASPVPPQTGRTSYVDSDRITAGLGASYDFPLWSMTTTVGLDLLLHRLLPREVSKRTSGAGAVRDEVPDDAVGGTPRGAIAGREGLQTNSPGFPGFSSEGVIFGGGARISLAY